MAERHKNALNHHHCVALPLSLWLKRHADAMAFEAPLQLGSVV